MPLAIPYPAIDPVAISLGPLSIKWYGLAYMSGLLIGWLLIKRMLATPSLWRDGKAPFTPLATDDLLLYTTIAVVIGGRLGQVLLYDPGYYLSHPGEILQIWRGGMSFHGGFLGAVLAAYLFARQHKTSVLSVWDLAAAVAPVGILFGRLANFINSEHWGRPSDVPWAMVFPNGGPLARHPSQLYEAALEGLALFVLLRMVSHGMGGLKRPGLVSGVFLIGYGIARSFCEVFREPEEVHALNLGPLTVGMLYSIPMILVGLYMVRRARLADGVR